MISKILLSFLMIAVPASLHASELRSKINSVAQKISKAAESPGAKPAVVAVLPLEADERLSRKRVNSAVAELLTNALLRQKKVDVVERTQIYEVLKERKLGLSGAIDSQSAAGIGKLLGAKLLVLGSVGKLGKYYQFVFKLVETDTARIIASEIIEEPIVTFDEEAAPYLALVPERQTIGPFYLVGWSPESKVKNYDMVLDGITFDAVAQDMYAKSNGVGLRYWISAKLMAELSSTSALVGSPPPTVEHNILNGYKSPSQRFSFKSYRLVFTGISNLSKSFRVYWGGGAMLIRAQGVRADLVWWPTHFRYNRKGTSRVAPVLTSGLEWKPQERIGLSIFSHYSIIPFVVKGDLYRYNQYLEVDLKRTVWKGTVPQLSIEASFALYF